MKLRQQGMTLLEVMLALAIFSVAALALLNSLGGMLNGHNRIRQQIVATWLADNQLVEATLNAGNGVTEGQIKMAGSEWRWQSRQTTDENSSLTTQRISVSIDDHQAAELHRFLLSSGVGKK